MENLTLLLKKLLESKLEFVLIGGYASVVHGSSQVTHDLDICAVITPKNIQMLREALKELNPVHRMNPNHQPSLNEYPREDVELQNYYLKTSAGVLDIISQVNAVGDFNRVKEKSIAVELFGKECRVISLDDLIEVKKSMTRDKDKNVLRELIEIKNKISS